MRGYRAEGVPQHRPAGSGAAVSGLPGTAPAKALQKTCHRNSSPGFPFLAIPLRAEPLVYLVGEVHSHS